MTLRNTSNGFSQKTNSSAQYGNSAKNTLVGQIQQKTFICNVTLAREKADGAKLITIGEYSTPDIC
jgi:hypothetical protein